MSYDTLWYIRMGNRAPDFPQPALHIALERQMLTRRSKRIVVKSGRREHQRDEDTRTCESPNCSLTRIWKHAPPWNDAVADSLVCRASPRPAHRRFLTRKTGGLSR